MRRATAQILTGESLISDDMYIPQKGDEPVIDDEPDFHDDYDVGHDTHRIRKTPSWLKDFVL